MSGDPTDSPGPRPTCPDDTSAASRPPTAAGTESPTDPGGVHSRRAFLGAVVAGGTLLAGCSGGDDDERGPPVGEGSPDNRHTDGESWMAGVANYDGYAVHTGESAVTVRVGAPYEDGNAGFEPAAVIVSTGTTVVWEWTGKGGRHGVAERNGAFQSDVTDQEGYTFEQTFEASRVVRYSCPVHRDAGMKGSVLVKRE